MQSSYHALEHKVKLQLAQALEMRKATFEEVMAILFIFGQTKNIEQLEGFTEIFSEIFPILKTLQLQKTEGQKRNIEEIVKKTVATLLTTDPLRATALAKDSLNTSLTLEQLQAKYPEINE